MASNNGTSNVSSHKHKDWYCHGCGTLMFLNGSHCSKCKSKRTSNKNKRPSFDSWTIRSQRPSTDSWSLPSSSRSVSVVKRRAGDWECPNCEVLIFASKSECRKCKAQKPTYNDPPRESETSRPYVDPPQEPTKDDATLIEEEERKAKQQLLKEEYQANPDRCPCGNVISWCYRTVVSPGYNCFDCSGPYRCRYGKCGHGFVRTECWKC